MLRLLALVVMTSFMTADLAHAQSTQTQPAIIKWKWETDYPKLVKDTTNSTEQLRIYTLETQGDVEYLDGAVSDIEVKFLIYESIGPGQWPTSPNFITDKASLSAAQALPPTQDWKYKTAECKPCKVDTVEYLVTNSRLPIKVVARIKYKDALGMPQEGYFDPQMTLTEPQ